MKLGLLVMLLFVEWQFSVGVLAAFSLLIFGFSISTVAGAILLWFLWMSSWRLMELGPLVKKLATEQYDEIRDLATKVGKNLKVYGPFFGILTAIVLSLWQMGVADVGIYSAWLLLFVIMFQMMVWHTVLGDITAIGQPTILTLIIFFPLSLGFAGASAYFALKTGIPPLLDYSIVFGGFGISYCLLYNFVSSIWLTPPQAIRSAHELRERQIKLKKLEGKCTSLLLGMYAQNVMPKRAKTTPIIISEKHLKYYIGAVGKQTKFFDMEKKVEVTNKNFLRQLNIAVNLKKKLDIILSTSVRKQISLGRVMGFLIYSRFACSKEKALRMYPELEKFRISKSRKKLERKMFRSDFAVWSVIHWHFSPQLARVQKLLFIFDEVPSVDVAIEICKEVKQLQKSSDMILTICKEREKIWEEYKKQSKFLSLVIGPEELRKSVESAFEWLSLVSDAS